MHLKKLDLSDTTLFPLGRISILVIAVKLAAPKWNTSGCKRHAALGDIHVKQNVLILFTVLELYLTRRNERWQSVRNDHHQKLTLSRVTRASNLYSGSALSPVASICKRIRSCYRCECIENSTLAVSSPPPSAGTAPEASAISLSVHLVIMTLPHFELGNVYDSQQSFGVSDVHIGSVFAATEHTCFRVSWY